MLWSYSYVLNKQKCILIVEFIEIFFNNKTSNITKGIIQQSIL